MTLADPDLAPYRETCIESGELNEHDVATFVWIAHDGELVKETGYYDDWKILLDDE